ncbi:molybdenum cofactor guanylyltransferase MobA [Rhizobium oryziradicis]|uniref:Molybdenum cofactor guanylyltransferase n=1 Tax=Rhizobium oryziradicis TaxID=1867956 RepID=A0A1Q8ZNQ4_9HYPH|nr:molybdenum cofactor guanylyltransferase MobA [Rhizobium oryziradicis]OLP43408.1 molybdenum cofactor guanylyltransferase [Rhizobium oryziradicis]
MVDPRCRTHVPGVILAGGLSRRMGQSKAATLLAGKPMLDHILARLLPQVSALAINSNAGLTHRDFPTIADAVEDHPGPLAGIARATQFARTVPDARHVLTVPVDTPFLPHNLAAALLGAQPGNDAVVLACSNGRMHPVIGLWPVMLAEQITHWLQNPQNRKLMVFLQTLNVVSVDFADVETAIGPVDPFFNVNTPDDLAQAEHYLKALQS